MQCVGTFALCNESAERLFARGSVCRWFDFLAVA